MLKPDIIAIGASAGGVEVLREVVAGFPADLNAALFVVVHIGNGMHGRSLLPEILSSAGPLPAVHPSDGERIRKGQIYVAVPDYHMTVGQDCVHLVYGPKENLTRPAINPLFRSAAAAFGPRVIGVILTGRLDDGIAGLAEIKRRGGVAVVQDPSDADFPSMPMTALDHVKVDHITPANKMASLLASLVNTERHYTTEVDEPVEKHLIQINCPECGGPVWEERQGQIVEYRCRVGHTYSPTAFKEAQQDTVEASLWGALVSLEGAADMAERLSSELGPEFVEDARRKRQQANALRDLLNDFSLRTPSEEVK